LKTRINFRKGFFAIFNYFCIFLKILKSLRVKEKREETPWTKAAPSAVTIERINFKK